MIMAIRALSHTVDGLCGEARDKGDEPIKCVVICREDGNAEYNITDPTQQYAPG